MRARQGEDFSRDHFDLLPFINILMCTLGCLLLVTLSIAALSLGPSAGEGWIASQRDSTPATRKQPVLIEWDGTAVSAHLPAGRIQAKWTPPLDVGMFLIQREQTSELPGCSMLSHRRRRASTRCSRCGRPGSTALCGWPMRFASATSRSGTSRLLRIGRCGCWPRG